MTSLADSAGRYQKILGGGRVVPSSLRRGEIRGLSALETIYEDELGDDIAATHVLFLPKYTNLGLAPFPALGQSGTPDVVEEAQE